jgi:DNA mismatch repair ATPase MutL
MDAMLRQVEECENAGQCNHGRRAYAKLSLRDLEKLFDR